MDLSGKIDKDLWRRAAKEMAKGTNAQARRQAVGGGARRRRSNGPLRNDMNDFWLGMGVGSAGLLLVQIALTLILDRVL